ncbi:MAG: TRAP transporter substrate-binding protein [Desulfobacterales bacterium]
MKRFAVAALMLFFSTAVLTAWPASASAETVNLTYSIFFPSTHGQCEAGVAWAEEIENRSDGKVKITVFPGGTLTKANQTFDGVVNGITDIGMSCFAYTRGRFPVMEALDLPLGYSSGTVATRVANEFFQMNSPQELDNVKVLYLHAHGPGLLHTRKPVRTLTDIQKMKIRSTGLSAKVVEALGGVPVAMDQGATYEALQKGVVEGTFGPIEVLKGWRQAEVISHTTDCHSIGYTTTMFVVMNTSKWNALPDDLKKVFEDVSSEWIAVHGSTWDEVDEAGRQYTLSRGNEIISLDPEEQNKWRRAVQPVIAEYVESAAAKGIPGQKYVDDITGLISTITPNSEGE